MYLINSTNGTETLNITTITNIPDDYCDIFSTELFTIPKSVPQQLNWLEKMDRTKGKQHQRQQVEVKTNEQK